MYDLKRPPIAAANDDACLTALSGGPIIAAWGMGVDSTAMSVENRLAHIRAVVSCGIEHLSGTIKFIRRIGSRFIIGV